MVRAMAGRPDPLASQPFSYATRADGTVVIRYHTAPVTLLRGKAAASFMARIATATTGLRFQTCHALVGRIGGVVRYATRFVFFET
jgi:hypothetical protein